MRTRSWNIFFRAGWMALSMLVPVTGCTTSPTPASPQTPFFRSDSQDLKSFQALGRKQDNSIAKCGASADCDQALYLRGLIALFESRELARGHFQKILAQPQKSKYAPASQQWLQLLQNPSISPNSSWLTLHANTSEIVQENGNLARTLERLVRDLLGKESEVQHLTSAKEAEATTVDALHRELADRQKKIDELSTKKEPARTTVDATTVHSLQAQLEQRDRKIEELTHQLEALKRIDQEMREKARPIRPQTAPTPLTGEPEQKP